MGAGGEGGGLSPRKLQRSAFAAVPDTWRWRMLGLQQGLHEPEVRIVPEACRRGGTAVDVGAWWGPWTWRMARHADKVVVVEPVPELAAFLRGVVPASVEIIEAAASSETGRAMLAVPTDGIGSEGRSSLTSPPAGARLLDVRTIRLDELDLQEVRLLKVDVEGHEMEVIRGARDTLMRCRPTLVVELEQRHHDRPLAAAFAEIEEHGYSGRFADGRRWRPLEEFDVERWQTSMSDRVAASGYLGSIRYRSRYRNNFVFDPLP